MLIHKVMKPRIPQKLGSLRKPVNKGACYVNQKHRGKPLLFHDKCSGLFYALHHNYGLTSHTRDKAIMWLSVLLKDTIVPGQDSNPHSDNARTWVWCTRSLGHIMIYIFIWNKLLPSYNKNRRVPRKKTTLPVKWWNTRIMHLYVE